MPAYPGIHPDALWLLSENRFHDSKEFYEEHKREIRSRVLDPLRALVEDLSPTVLKIDPHIVVDPGRNGCVSRIRRDNRYSRDKSLYRENVWVAFMRDKKAWDCIPGFFADFSLKESTYGMGFYASTPALMQMLRRMMDENAAPFLKAAKKALAAGFSISGERYARRKKEGLPPLLDELYNRKNIDFTRTENDPAFFGSTDLPAVLTAGFQALAPFYRLLTEAAERELEERGKE
ncbi:MAG: DUF2461 domain-containing protein [Clostridiales bacterium]|nr:DUF2461 domain-containing protein [Clostridiales bacterium]